jgi:hypothetical protein
VLAPPILGQGKLVAQKELVAVPRQQQQRRFRGGILVFFRLGSFRKADGSVWNRKLLIKTFCVCYIVGRFLYPRAVIWKDRRIIIRWKVFKRRRRSLSIRSLFFFGDWPSCD